MKKVTKIKSLIALLIAIILISCVSDNEKISDKKNVTSLNGNWYAIEKLDYSEFYFTDSTMFVYDPYAGHVISYKYYLKNDSIYRVYNHPETLNDPYKFYQKVVSVEKELILLGDFKLVKYSNGLSLEAYLNNEELYIEYENDVQNRMKSHANLLR